jgi:hypothetical protein
MVDQLQEQAKDGQIDSALLDQLESVLGVSASDAPDAHSSGKSDMSSATPTSSNSKSVTSDTTSVSKVEPSTPPPAKGDDKPAPAPAEPPSAPAGDADEDKTTVPPEDSMTTPESAEKAEQPMSTRPPVPNLIFDHVEEVNQKIPSFIKAMEGGSLKEAQKIAGMTGVGFDTLMNASMHALLTEGGWTSDNLEKLSGMAAFAPGKLAKGISASTVPGIYLIKLAKLMLPLYAGLTNRIPTQSPPQMASDQATWKAQLGFGSIAMADFFRIAEAATGVNPPTSFLTYNAPFRDITVNDSVTLKALATTRGYSDPMQISVIKAMSALLVGQERIILGSSVDALTPVTAVTAASGSGGSLAAGSYVFGVTALTYEGWLAQSAGGSAAVGESTATYASSAVVSASGIATLTWAAVPGAVAYNVYAPGSGSSGSTGQYNQTVLINKAVVTKASGSAALTPPTADSTVNASYGMAGLIQWCEQSIVYSNTSPTKITPYDCAGAGLTVGNGGIEEIDYQLAEAWEKWQIAHSLMIMSPKTNAALVGKLQQLGGGNFFRLDVTNERNTVNGGLMVTGYVNKFAPFADGTPRMIDIIPHPYMPDGTILMIAETIPYPMGNESRGFVRDTLLPYTYFPLPSQASGVNKLQYNYAITTSEVVECFNPSPQTAIVGFDRTL